MSLLGKAKEASSRQLGRETQRLPAVEQGSPQSTRGPVSVACPWRLRAFPRASSNSDKARAARQARLRPAGTLRAPDPVVQSRGALRPRACAEGRRERRVDAGRGSRLRVGFASVIGFCPGGGRGERHGSVFTFSSPPLPEAVGFYFRLLAPSLGKSTCSLRPLGVSGWVPFHDSLGEGRRWADERRGACGLRA